MKKFTKALCLFLAILMTLSLVACGEKAPEAPAADSGAAAAPEAAKKEEVKAEPAKDTIVFANSTDFDTLDPVADNNLSGYYLIYMFGEGLFTNLTADGKVANAICTEYEVEEDENGEPTIWHLKIREGVKFSDGTELTAEDVAATLTRCKESTGITSLTNFYSHVEVTDANTVTLYTNGVYSSVPEALANKAFVILPKALIDSGYDFGPNPISCGPYKIVEWIKSDSVKLVANEHYYGGAPGIPNVVVKIIPEATSRSINLEAGDVDLAYSVATTDVARLQGDSNFVVSVTPGSMWTYLGLNAINPEQPEFADVNFRKAVSSMINRDAVIAVGADGYGTPEEGVISSIFPGTTVEGSATYDPEAAKEYLEAWGGDPSSVEFTIYVNSDVRRRMGEVIQSQLGEYGLTVHVEQIEAATLASNWKTDDTFDSAISAYTSADLLTWLNGLYKTGGADTARTRQGGIDVNSYINKIQSCVDPAEREKLLTEACLAMNEAQTLIGLYQNANIIAFGADLGGVTITPEGFIRVQDLYFN